ncbi:MAG: peptidoglycan bridge formation glycyltransferase FemA/FemB family protein, partial [bacterium]|nr:peptidoglycan bridge formation glycyltransferase FemA/FemB family protein [bacterium]
MEFSGTQKEWNQRCLTSSHTQFLQSYEWGLFQHALGREVRYLVGSFDDDIQCLAIKYPLMRNFFYFMCPRGPVGTPTQDWWHEFFQWAQKNGALFTRVEPSDIVSQLSSKMKHVRDVDPAVTRIIDLETSEQTLLSNMHQKTRYNINLAMKKNIQVKVTSFEDITEKEIEVWWQLSKETAKRNSISVHPLQYYKTLFTTFPYISLFTARLGDMPIAMAVHVSFGDTVSYVYGASTHEHKETMAPYLLQWH